MGSCIGKNSKSQSQYLLIGTLNYSGIMNNPFQFYCNQTPIKQNLQKVSAIFRKLITQYLGQIDEKFQWKCSKIDQKIRDRYSPFFKKDAGLNRNGKLQTKSQFKQEWDKIFDQCLHSSKLQAKPEQRQNIFLFDFIIYHTLINFTYSSTFSKEQLNQPFISYLDPQLYKTKMEEFFSLSYLDFQRKLYKLQEQLNKSDPDVLFLQQYEKRIQTYAIQSKLYFTQIDEQGDQIILIKKGAFKDQKHKNKDQIFLQLFGKQHAKQMIKKWQFTQKKVVFLAVDRYIFIGLHLSSKAELNKNQVNVLQKVLLQFYQRARPKYHIIVGGDLNSFVQSFEMNKFNFYPNNKDLYTTRKKRTYAQAQFKKADVEVNESKDKIISSLPFKQTSVSFIDGTSTKQSSLVPSNQHPFDHFLVLVTIGR